MWWSAVGWFVRDAALVCVLCVWLWLCVCLYLCLCSLCVAAPNLDQLRAQLQELDSSKARVEAANAQARAARDDAVAHIVQLEEQGASEDTRITAHLVAQARMQDVTRLQAQIETIDRERDHVGRLILPYETGGALKVLQFASRHV